jgi:transposase
MSYEIKPDYSQLMLFPPNLDEMIPAEHPARYIRDFVDDLDLRGLGFKIREAETGRPNFSANLLLKVWLYGFLIKIRSTRGLEQACYDHLGMLWLTTRQTPDHNTLHRFFRDNKRSIQRLFRTSVAAAMKLDMVGLVLHAVDGTKIAAASSTRSVLDRKVQQKLLKRLDETIESLTRSIEASSTVSEESIALPAQLLDAEQRREKLHAVLQEMDEIERDHVHPIEPDARMIKTEHGVRLAYNAQMVADQGGIIVAQEVTNAVKDNEQLVPMLEKVEEVLGAVASETLADGGYVSTEQLHEAEQHQYSVIVSLPATDDNSPYHINHFVYDEQRDAFICPQKQALTFRSEKKTDGSVVRIYRSKACQNCSVRAQCTKSSKGRSLEVAQHYGAWRRQQQKHAEPDVQATLRRRKVIIEPVFGWLKAGFGFRRWTVKGFDNVRAQWALIATVMNLARIHRRLLLQQT